MLKTVAQLLYLLYAAALAWWCGEPVVAAAKSPKLPGGGKGLFGPLSDVMVPKMPKPPEAPTPPPPPETPKYDEEATRAAADEAARKAVLEEEEERRRRRLRSTTASSPMGDLTPAPVTKRTLLGS